MREELVVSRTRAAELLEQEEGVVGGPLDVLATLAGPHHRVQTVDPLASTLPVSPEHNTMQPSNIVSPLLDTHWILSPLISVIRFIRLLGTIPRFGLGLASTIPMRRLQKNS